MWGWIRASSFQRRRLTSRYSLISAGVALLDLDGDQVLLLAGEHVELRLARGERLIFGGDTAGVPLDPGAHLLLQHRGVADGGTAVRSPKDEGGARADAGVEGGAVETRVDGDAALAAGIIGGGAAGRAREDRGQKAQPNEDPDHDQQDRSAAEAGGPGSAAPAVHQVAFDVVDLADARRRLAALQPADDVADQAWRGAAGRPAVGLHTAAGRYCPNRGADRRVLHRAGADAGIGGDHEDAGLDPALDRVGGQVLRRPPRRRPRRILGVDTGRGETDQRGLGAEVLEGEADKAVADAGEALVALVDQAIAAGHDSQQRRPRQVVDGVRLVILHVDTIGRSVVEVGIGEHG